MPNLEGEGMNFLAICEFATLKLSLWTIILLHPFASSVYNLPGSFCFEYHPDSFFLKYRPDSSSEQLVLQLARIILPKTVTNLKGLLELSL